MLRFLLGLGVIYVVFQIGREYGRTEAEVMLMPPVDYERHPRPRGYDELEETT
ncbi:hypothetical protein [Mesorhizobium silamurunense]|uniref:hypothetical protein n=1 Tax=Mesorhizobium silamurunense TaxID=499528 RepID=UPI00177B46E6|nr:hypothetical protein [Mesorhizobium silamurunense]